jgi:UDP-glucose 4-epimerase
MSKVKKILVIGGSGFLGSHVADELTKQNFDVTIYDITKSKWLNPNQKMVVGDISDIDLLDSTIQNCFAVYNFAAISDLNEAINKPVETVKVNILNNVNVLELCKKHKVNRYIYASSIYVNSRDGGFYRCSKRAAEEYIEEYNLTYGLDFTILRYGSLYGPRSDHHNGLWRIINDAIINQKIVYEGSIEAMREYIHINDAAKASVEILNDKFKNQHIVLTGLEPMKVIDVLKMISEILNFKNEVEFKNATYRGHYIRTPYAYQPKIGKKYIPTLHVDLGQGLLDLINEIYNNK